MEYLEGEKHSQYEGNLRAHRSMRDYRNSPWMNVPSCMVPPTNVPYGNSYKPSWRNHLNLSWGLEPPQYAPPASPSYASTPQSQPPQSTSLMEQAILNLTKLVGDFVEEQKTIDRPKTQCVKCTPMCASVHVAPSNIVYSWYGYRSTGTGVLTTEVLLFR